jgi:metal-dependent HD superfamily phosphatase/phosphodiesterase
MEKEITLSDVKLNPQINEFIKRSTQLLRLYHYTDHGIEHANLVADRAYYLAKEVNFSKREQELSAISGYVHDMGNFLDRKYHEYWGAILFQTIFQNKIFTKDLVTIMQAVANHDNCYVKIVSSVAAAVVLADKSDVRRTRVMEKNKENIKKDIHNRVNFAATENKFKVDNKNKIITLKLKIDTSFVPIMEYFEIFTHRMVQCRKAAEFLNYKFALVINDFKLL